LEEILVAGGNMKITRGELRRLIREVIKKVGSKYVLYPKKGGPRLGTHPSRAAAERQERAIKASKYSNEGNEPAKGTGKKPKGSSRRLYTDENPKDTVSVKFRTASDIRKTLAKKSFKSKSHKRQSQIINLIHQRARAAYKNAKDPKTKARLKRAYEYAKERKEASKRKTQRMRKQK
jgi:hypothetical protein